MTRDEAGYALTEVLVAAAIAGAVLAAGMIAFAGGASSLRSAGDAHEAGLIARNIEARLTADRRRPWRSKGMRAGARALRPWNCPPTRSPARC